MDEPVDESVDERALLLADLAAMQREWEATLLPSLAERVLAIRLTTQQLKVLALLGPAAEGDTMQQLAGTLDVSLATMSGIVDRLEAHGMVTRSPDPHDQRVRRVAATAAGLAVVRKLITTQPDFTDSPLRQVPIADLRTVTAGMRILLDALRTAG